MSAGTSALDSSVLIAVAKHEKSAEAWVEIIAKCGAEGRVVACEVAVAETFAFIQDEKDMTRLFEGLGVQFDAIGWRASLLAGRIFGEYRRRGGSRPQLIPDFLIAAHASVQADCLLAADRGYTRTYFPKLRVVAPN